MDDPVEEFSSSSEHDSVSEFGEEEEEEPKPKRTQLSTTVPVKPGKKINLFAKYKSSSSSSKTTTTECQLAIPIKLFGAKPLYYPNKYKGSTFDSTVDDDFLLPHTTLHESLYDDRNTNKVYELPDFGYAFYYKGQHIAVQDDTKYRVTDLVKEICNVHDLPNMDRIVHAAHRGDALHAFMEQACKAYNSRKEGVNMTTFFQNQWDDRLGIIAMIEDRVVRDRANALPEESFPPMIALLNQLHAEEIVPRFAELPTCSFSYGFAGKIDAIVQMEDKGEIWDWKNIASLHEMFHKYAEKHGFTYALKPRPVLDPVDADDDDDTPLDGQRLPPFEYWKYGSTASQQKAGYFTNELERSPDQLRPICIQYPYYSEQPDMISNMMLLQKLLQLAFYRKSEMLNGRPMSNIIRLVAFKEGCRAIVAYFDLNLLFFRTTKIPGKAVFIPEYVDSFLEHRRSKFQARG